MRREDPSGVWEVDSDPWSVPCQSRPDDQPTEWFIEFRPDGTGHIDIEGRTQPFEVREFGHDVSVFSLRFIRRKGEPAGAVSGTVVLQDGCLQGVLEWPHGDRHHFFSSRRISERSPRSGSEPSGIAAWASAVPPWLRPED